MTTKRRGYPSDVSDEEWAFCCPYLTLMKEDAPQREYPLRELFNALRWMVRAGCPWRMMPTNMPPWHAVHQQAQRWIKSGCFESMAHDLRAILRLAAGKEAQPSAVILDGRTMQSTPESGGRAGYDGHKRRKGSKVHAAVDTLGHLLALKITPANEQERAQVGELARDVQEVIIDARYEKVRRDGVVLDCAILGVSTALSEAEVHWRTFLTSLQDRGLHGTTFIVSDDHKGIRAALAARFAGVPWQRCQFHLQQNLMHYVPKIAMRSAVARELREVLHAHTRSQADALLNTMVAKYRKSAPELADWLEANVPESLTVLSLPPEHRARMRTSNGAERLNQEIKRRTRVARVFPNPDSLLRLVTAVLAEISDEWESGKIHLNMNPPSYQQAA